ncbi:plasmid pRiA4b ORF-3 family protein [Pelagerythrobacter aerophilus]|jgi:hypothetical protein
MTETIARLRISLDDIEPEIWRIVDMPLTGSLRMLHDVIQAAMGWQDYHLWQFEAGDRLYGVPDPDWPYGDLAAARNVRLGALIERGIRDLTYTYDMGDDWRHTVTVESVGLGDPDIHYPRFVTGERRCPPEDVGGFPGFEMFLDAMANPSHEEHTHLRRWHGGPFNADDIDEQAITRGMAAIAKRRQVGKAAYARSQKSA